MVKTTPILTDDWYGCYGDLWKGIITDESFAHPAKFSRALIARIVDHLIDGGYVEAGSTVIDPFGGVALGALPCLLRGLNWQGVELEQKFVDLGNANLALWRERFGRLLKGEATLVQGDSRRLMDVVRSAGAVMSSPPFSPLGCQPTGQGQGVRSDYREGKKKSAKPDSTYGETDGQLGRMREGDLSAIISSPPYGGSLESPNGIDASKLKRAPERNSQSVTDSRYGQSDGQLGAMKEGGFEACVSSPPYAGDSGKSDRTGHERAQRCAAEKGLKQGLGCFKTSESYGRSDGQLGAMKESGEGETFWQAARAIVEQCYFALAPNAVASWVVKGFVRKGKYVDFPDQWRRLCESVGFETIHYHRCWLTEELGEQGGLFGESKIIKSEKKSFFRRLCESKGSPRVDYEVVLCVRKRADR